ncbi:uncharacterized protein LOC142229564 [Haematobia irritans]|uniref:uncharacterized protein LOC142229564 n=1 Tax=Haematobia irritans TaxID=7368 RepID=UPI003F502821
MGLLEELLVHCEEIISYEKQLRESDEKIYNEMALEAEKEEIQNLWAEWKNLYKKCSNDTDLTKENKVTMKKCKADAHNGYIKCMSIIGSWKDGLKPGVPSNQKSNNSISVPPCDTPVFHGDYQSWPSFRDLFTAIYVNNKKLSPVEKLYHLFQKTSGEARDINKNIPLTAERFDIAWGNLKTQYENKRILINSQLRTLFNLTQCTHENSCSLKNLQREIKNCMSVLKEFNIDISSWDSIFVYQCCSKLPRLTLSLWEQSIAKNNEVPKWEDLDTFLTERFHALESVSDIMGSNESGSRQRNANNEKSRQYKVHHTKVNNQKCFLCKANHNLKSCAKFLHMNFKDRLSTVKRASCCLNCLNKGHIASACQTKHSCLKCNMKHHTLLHKNSTVQHGDSNNVNETNTVAQMQQTQNIQSTDTSSSSENVRAFHTSVANRTMLATAWVKIVKDHQSFSVRALIDPCSDDSFISAKIQKLLRLPTKPISAEITGLGNQELTKCTRIATFTLSSMEESKFSVEMDALVVSDVTGNVPTHTFENICISQLPKLKFADPGFFKSGPIDVLIGGNLYPLILLKGVENGILGSLVAQETLFGWMLTGPTSSRTSGRIVRVSHCTRVCINELMAKFWEIEEIPKTKILSEDDKRCEEIYKRTTIRMPDGRYIVDLPFRLDPPLNATGNSSRYVALCQFLRNEKTLSRKPEFKSMYDEVITEYLTLGHMKRIEAPSKEMKEYYYLPHHGIFKPERSTTKLRVVFNASCPSFGGKSLNDYLMVRPVLQKDIVTLLLNWRLYKFLNTVTFGVNCAPYLALRTLLQLADDESRRFPIGSKILKECMYVDDALVGSHSIAEAITAREQLVQILESGGFEIRKWTSNCKTILENLPREHLLNSEFLDFDEKSVAKTLGITWDAVSDSFYFVSEKLEEKPFFTKREVLSIIARLFDPLGWLAPVVITAKVLMQQLWLDEIEWDDHLKPLTLIKWKTFVKKYKDIDTIRIPRWIKYSPACKIELHGFCDSSEMAYAAVLFARVEIDGKIFSNLLVSKTRVAPIKKLSLPRLELCGALLLSELIHCILPQLKLPKCSLFLWSDSTIVLAWLKKPSYTWVTFVANRVAKIHDRVGNCWRHISTHENPADLATRGMAPLELKENRLWWYGPEWLQQDSSFWPSNSIIPDTNIESKSIKVHLARSAENEDIICRFSCLSRAIHVIGYILRFMAMTHPKLKQIKTFTSPKLSSKELVETRFRLIILSQKMYFPEEYDCLINKRSLHSKSSLLSLSPFLDTNHVMRANGRLGSTLSLSYNERHPVILSQKSHFAKLYIDFIHKLTLHGGIRLMLATVRLECWIVKAKNLIKTHVHNCQECVVARKNMQKQVMATLPPERTTLTRPFTNTGVDYAGPFDIKTYSGRGCRITKGYICLFVCFCTRAIHLEAVSELSTPAFLAALTRFVSRRGCPNIIYSDNVRNFVGAAREIRESLSKTLTEVKDAVLTRYSFQKIEWHFIPASAPHMGGLWEAGVKSCKTHLKKVAGQVKSEPEIVPSTTALLNRWHRLKVIQQEFCRRWKSDYLKELHKRCKWKQPHDDLRENDLVILRHETGGQNDWRMGRVIKIHRGVDNHVRVVDLKTQFGMDYQEEFCCPLCTSRHSFRKCRRFLVMHPSEKRTTINRYKACENCLGLSHQKSRCPSAYRCKNCGERHHTLLHPLDTTQFEWLTMTALAQLRRITVKEKYQPVLVELDPNRPSMAYRSSECCPLNLPEHQGYVKFQFTDAIYQTRTLTTCIEDFDGNVPWSPPRPGGNPRPLQKRYANVDMANPFFAQCVGASIVLGEDVSSKIYLGLPHEQEGLPYAQNTIFGWAFFGPLPLIKKWHKLRRDD